MKIILPGSGDAEPIDSTPGGVDLPRWYRMTAAVSWRFLVIAGAFVLILLLVVRLRIVVIPLIVAAMIATIITPPVARLKRMGWPPLVATWTVLLAAALLLGGSISLLAPTVADQVRDLGPALEEGLEEVENWAARTFFGGSDDVLETLQGRATDFLRDNVQQITGGVLGGAVAAIEIVSGLFLVIVLSFFLIKDGEQISGWLLGQFPRSAHERVRRIGRGAWEALGGYVRGVAIIGLVNSVALGIGLAFLGVPIILPLMFLTFIGAFLPLIGAVLAGAVAALVALVAGGPVDALIVVALVIVVQQVEGDVLSPMVFSRSLQLHPVAILLALPAGAVLGGLVGAFLSVPMVGIVSRLIAELRREPPQEAHAPATLDR
jgi:predicted PurR-regulated permease PerM